MAVQETVSRARVERDLAAVVAGQRMAGAEPTVEDVDAARRVLAGEVSATQAVRMRFAQIEARFGIVR
jgi:hypothetical protein